MPKNNTLTGIIIFILTIINLIGIFIAYARVITLEGVTCYSQTDPFWFDFIFRLSIGFIYLSFAIMIFGYSFYKKNKDKRIILSIKIAFVSLIISFSLLAYTFFKGLAF
jgi:hypothetical protein